MKQEYAHSIVWYFAEDDVKKLLRSCWKIVRKIAGIYEDIWYGLTGNWPFE